MGISMTRLRRLILAGLCCLLTAGGNYAQNQAPKAAVAAPPAEAAPAANPADVSSPDAILTAVYDVISGPAGQKRDWNRFRSLFYSGARLIPTDAKKEGGFKLRSYTAQEYIDRGAPYFEQHGFFEKEIARRTEQWGNILQTFSTYESRHETKDATPFARGINSFQLFFDGTRWWVVTIFWQEETPSTPLTAEFLPHSK
jgi:hypothetical protein